MFLNDPHSLTSLGHVHRRAIWVPDGVIGPKIAFVQLHRRKIPSAIGKKPSIFSEIARFLPDSPKNRKIEQRGGYRFP
jgi:hypothetical protein